MADQEIEDPCAGESGTNKLGLRVGGIFIILATSAFGTLFPILGKRYFHMRKSIFNFAKYFGSGVLIATAFIHLLTPADESLTSECLTGTWQLYPWANAIAMATVFAIFIVELFAFRIGTAKLKAAGFGSYDAHDHAGGASHAAHGPEVRRETPPATLSPDTDIEIASDPALDEKHDHALSHEYENMESGEIIAQLMGVAVLEFGVVFHSIFIGLTLATDPSFTVLFIVIIFHQMFEGLGLGSRLAFLPLPHKYNWVPAVAGFGYSCVTPIGMAIGLGVRSSYNGSAAKTLIASGVLDSISAGVLLYTGLVELLAHEFIFNKEMINASNGHVLYALGSMLTGAGIMALLGRWA